MSGERDPFGTEITEELVHEAVREAIVEDRRNRRVATRIAYSLIGAGLLIFSLMLWSNQSRIDDQARAARDLATSLRTEGNERRSQTCTTFETAYRQEVDQLISTYAFLEDLPRHELGGSLARAVLRNLPKLEVDALTDSDAQGANVPPYCDERGVGLVEPDPKVPRRPERLDGLLPDQRSLLYDPKPSG
jgi:hypothetical protein